MLGKIWKGKNQKKERNGEEEEWLGLDSNFSIEPLIAKTLWMKVVEGIEASILVLGSCKNGGEWRELASNDFLDFHFHEFLH